MAKRGGSEADIIRQAMERRIHIAAAAGQLGVSARTVWRRIARYREHGPDGLVHGLTGRPSNRAKPARIRARVTELYRQAPPEVPLSEFVRAVVATAGLEVSRETVRQWLIDAGMWRGKNRAA